MIKVRHIDFYPDEWLHGTSRLKPMEIAVYITACMMIYSHGGPIEKDDLRDQLRCPGRAFGPALDRLVEKGKLCLDGTLVMSKRCATELQKARNRIAKAVQNGSKGGRPCGEINDLGEPAGSFQSNLTTNLQPPKEDSVGADAPTAAAAAPPPVLRVIHPEPVGSVEPVARPPAVRDYVKEAFARCETILGPGGRGLVGEAKKLGYNSIAILDALDATEHYCIGEPVGYFRNCLRNTKDNMRRPSNGENLFEGADRAAEAIIKRYQGSLGDNSEDAEPLLDCVGPSGHAASSGRGLVRRLN